MVEQIFLSLQVKRSVLLVINWYIRVASRFDKRPKAFDLRKLKNIRKISILQPHYSQVLSLPSEMKVLPVLVNIS